MFIARGWVLNPLQGECWKILSLGIGLENPVSRDRIGQYYPVGRDGHQIHPRRVELNDSVKINLSLVMMRECDILSGEQGSIKATSKRMQHLSHCLTSLAQIHYLGDMHYTCRPSNTINTHFH